MSAHDDCAPRVQQLCDRLLSALNQHFAAINRNKAENMCSLGVGTTFAYVYHSRNVLRIYLRGTEADGPQLAALSEGTDSISIAKRKSMGSDWAKITPYYLDLNSDKRMTAAVPLLVYAARQRGTDRRDSYMLPSEDSACEMVEGARITVQVSRIEREPAARKMHCIVRNQLRCMWV